MNFRIKGSKAEGIAVKHLLDNGLDLIERNFSLKYGEIDIIMNEGDELVFVEVKSLFNGDPIFNLSKQKIRRLYTAINIYIQRNNLWDVEYRLDYVGVLYTAMGYEVEWIRNIEVY